MYDKTEQKYFKTKVFVMELTNLNPYIRYAAIHNTYRHKAFDSICYDCRLFFFLSGTGIVTADRNRYPFQKGTVLYFPPGTRYRFHLDKKSDDFSLVVINFDLISDFSVLSTSLGTATAVDFDPSRVMSYEISSEFAKVICRQLPELESSFRRIADDFLCSAPLHKETSSALIKLSLLELLLNNHHDAEQQRLAPVLEYIRKNYGDPELTNQAVAKAFNYHPHYLSQMLKQATGLTLHQYVTSYRLQMARQMLISTDDSIATISWKTGFQSTAYFIKLFRQESGVTPGTYRKRHKHILF